MRLRWQSVCVCVVRPFTPEDTLKEMRTTDATVDNNGSDDQQGRIHLLWGRSENTTYQFRGQVRNKTQAFYICFPPSSLACLLRYVLWHTHTTHVYACLISSTYVDRMWDIMLHVDPHWEPSKWNETQQLARPETIVNCVLKWGCLEHGVCGYNAVGCVPTHYWPHMNGGTVEFKLPSSEDLMSGVMCFCTNAIHSRRRQTIPGYMPPEGNLRCRFVVVAATSACLLANGAKHAHTQSTVVAAHI